MTYNVLSGTLSLYTTLLFGLILMTFVKCNRSVSVSEVQSDRFVLSLTYSEVFQYVANAVALYELK